MASSHPYVDSIVVTLVTAGFLLCLNFINAILDVALHCGLIGQIFMGVLFGTPGVKLLGDAFETNITILGYLGLILLVYEGGLSMSVSSLLSSSFVAFLVAATGVILPIALSFLLYPLGATYLQCFAAGASLSATSLGTTLTILSNAGLVNTDVGTVLTSAAMLDDIVGLIMLQVVSEISASQPSKINYVQAIARPVGASVALVTVAIITARFVLFPLCRRALPWFLSPNHHPIVEAIVSNQSFTFLAHTSILFIFVVAAGFAGTSPLLASFVAGVMIRWLGEALASDREASADDDRRRPLNGLQVYEQYYHSSTEAILKPFFFASIGFSIPITQMFRGPVLWKGFLYAVIMFCAKAATGLWLWIIPAPLKPFGYSLCSIRRRIPGASRDRRGLLNIDEHSGTPKTNSGSPSEPSDAQIDPLVLNKPEPPQIKGHIPHAPLLLGMAMVARGEIGFLIASVAASEDVFSPANRSPNDSDELYLVIVWAISICTILGPVAVGSLLRHIKMGELSRAAVGVTS